ncbi:MAG: AEC family transporter [Actinobacteria bacterium]|nr:AEC family transporter [Actinomycetota bacterium]MCL5674204.1 AEC family transporter [Candidatus Omnitrophota bacterium]
MFLKLFLTVFSIFLMMGFGFIAKKIRLINTDTTREMSHAIIKFFYPALIFSSLVNNFTVKSLLLNVSLPIGTLIIMVIGFIYGLLFSKVTLFTNQKEENSFRFLCTMNNYTFLPLPIILMLWGNKGVAMLIFSSLGAEICIWTLGIFSLTGTTLSRKNLKQVLSVPLLTIIFSFFIIVIRDSFLVNNLIFINNPIFSQLSKSLMSVLDVFGKACIPIAMFIVGGKMAELRWKYMFDVKLIYLSAIRLLIIPATSLAVFYFLPFTKNVNLIISVVAIMPSAIASVYLSEVYDSDVRFSSKGVLITHLFSLITIPLWLYFILR